MKTTNDIVKNALAHAVARNVVSNAKFKVGDKIKYGKLMCVVRKVDESAKMYDVDIDMPSGKKVPMRSEISEIDKYSVKNAAPMSAHEASVLLSSKRKAVTQYAKVEPNTLYYRALGGIFAVPESETMRSAIAAIGSRVLPYQVGGVVGNRKS